MDKFQGARGQLTCLLLFLSTATTSYAIDGDSYVDDSKPFILIEDANRQAEAWAICSAAYLILADFYESKPSQAKLFKQTSNGASVAVIMTHVKSGMDEDITPQKFDSLWKYSKLLGDELPAVQMTRIMADAESLPAEEHEIFLKKVFNTTSVCSQNLEGQQYYIDFWRDLVKSGLLTMPD